MITLDRRSVIGSLGALAVSGCAGTNRLTSPFSVGSGPPPIRVPRNACDSHIHIMDPRFPPTPGWRGGGVPDATVDAYRRYQARIGTTRVVVVTPSTYGIDNRATLEALDRFAGRARGVVVFDCDAPPADLAEMTQRGVRGVRMNFVSPQPWGKTDSRRLIATAKMAADRGWHVQIYARAKDIAALEADIAGLPVPVVIDHLGSVAPSDGVGSEGHAAILRLLANGRTWLKLSGAYISSVAGAPDYGDVLDIARSYVAAAPEHLVWGSDWPHRGQDRKLPDDAALLGLLGQWAPNQQVRDAILVANPERLYGF